MEYRTRHWRAGSLAVTCFDFAPAQNDNTLCDDVCDGAVCFAPERGVVRLYGAAAPHGLTYTAVDVPGYGSWVEVSSRPLRSK
ncbi:MAG: hypothetical protein B7733_16625 [Myxococcales bacterium FL481]|nr:MAG: hypothetical protein B7733_16625 [Myxococcales bacterium FL481]